jgi:hypothetical protein
MHARTEDHTAEELSSVAHNRIYAIIIVLLIPSAVMRVINPKHKKYLEGSEGACVLTPVKRYLVSGLHTRPLFATTLCSPVPLPVYVALYADCPVRWLPQRYAGCPVPLRVRRLPWCLVRDMVFKSYVVATLYTYE